jgi:hypothetical protein
MQGMEIPRTVRFRLSLAGALGIVTAFAVACGVSWFAGIPVAFLSIDWFTALCFCRSHKAVLIVAGLPIFAWIALGVFAIAGGFVRMVLHQ